MKDLKIQKFERLNVKEEENKNKKYEFTYLVVISIILCISLLGNAYQGNILDRQDKALSKANIDYISAMKSNADIQSKLDILTDEYNDLLNNQNKWIDVGVCSYDNSIKNYMDYRTITDTNSVQYSIVNQSIIDNGLLYYNDCICVAMGSYYGPIGSEYLITLESGQQFKVVKADAKSDSHTSDGCNNANGSILEFIVDTETLNYNSLILGDLNNLFKGEIVRIEKED